MRWITPFDLGEMPDASSSPSRPRPKDDIPTSEIPTLQDILDALISRMTVFMPNKHQTPEDVWALVDPEEQTLLWHALQQAPATAQPRPKLKPVPRYWPGRWTGIQTFEVIPQRILPYLEMASVLHVGRQTHFGCGTFRLD
jgi:hypothetical protein